MTRFELKLPERTRADLDLLADQTGLSTADLVRLAVSRLLANKTALLAERTAA
jgi:hypothetical protein